MVSVVLLGAGASFGSVDATPECPPLGDRLFDKLEAHGGVARSMPAVLKEIFRDQHFEAGMAAYFSFVEGDVMEFQRELAGYFAEFLPGPNSAYRSLVSQLGIRRVVYCSLNYDLLLEMAAEQLGIPTMYGINIGSWLRLLKLHGSCNFWPDVPVGMIRGSRMYGGSSADVEANIVPLNRAKTLHRCAVEDSLAPAIAIYAEGKSVRVSPGYIANQQKLFRESIARAANIFIAGVRVHQADHHIWSELGKAVAPAFYFGFPSDFDAFNDWKHAFSKKNAYFVEADFVKSIPIMRQRIFR